MRGKPEKFAEHYTQATLFWNSQSPVEKSHILRAFRFELTRVQTPAIRERVVSMLANVAAELAEGVATGLGIEVPAPMPTVVPKIAKPEVKVSKPLSLFARPGDGSVKTRRIAILVANGVDAPSLTALHTTLRRRWRGSRRFVGARLGNVAGTDDERIAVEVTLEAAPAVLFDALVIPDGTAAIEALGKEGHALEFIKDQYRHCKPILDAGQRHRPADQGADSGHLAERRTRSRHAAFRAYRYRRGHRGIHCRHRQASPLRAAGRSSARVMSIA